MVQEEISFEDISYLELWWPFCSAEQNNLCNFNRGHYEVHFYKSISSLGQWFKRRCRLKDCYWELWRPSCSVEQNRLCNLKEGSIGNTHVKLYEIRTSGLGGDVV